MEYILWKNLIVIIGYNYNNLLGSENDAILIYNIFIDFIYKIKKFGLNQKFFKWKCKIKFNQRLYKNIINLLN